MFQFASAYGIAKKRGYEVYFPEENTKVPSVEYFMDGVTRDITFDIPKNFKFDDSLLKKSSEIHWSNTVKEPHFHFSERLFEIPDHCDLSGYYQSEKYFDHCKKEVKNLLSYKQDTVEYVKEKYQSLAKKDRLRTTSIHFRLGDYLGLSDYHTVLNDEYYSSAIREVNDITDLYLVFSDNIDYVKSFFYDSEKIVYIEDGNDIQQMCLMSHCDNNIIANSSYSWWAAWLNENESKVVIAPKKWFGPHYEGVHNTKDLYCKNWVIV
jgi:hypothetical protein